MIESDIFTTNFGTDLVCSAVNMNCTHGETASEMIARIKTNTCEKCGRRMQKDMEGICDECLIRTHSS